jgi:hypothetical protein
VFGELNYRIDASWDDAMAMFEDSAFDKLLE